jgi:hypothetical protein
MHSRHRPIDVDAPTGILDDNHREALSTRVLGAVAHTKSNASPARKTRGRFCYSPCGAPCPFDSPEFSRELNSCVAIENRCETSFSFNTYEKAQ